MRTTLTLDDDVAAAIDSLRREQGLSLRDVVNTLLRLGIAGSARATGGPTPPTSSVSLGGCKLATLDDIAEALAIAEGEAFR